MLIRTTLAGLLLALGASLQAAPNSAPALREARVMASGGATGLGGSYDGTLVRSPIDIATEGALRKGGLAAPKNDKKAPPTFEVPAPKPDKDDPKKAKPVEERSHSTEKISMESGAAVDSGAGFKVGGLIGAFVGALFGGLAGFILSKLL